MNQSESIFRLRWFFPKDQLVLQVTQHKSYKISQFHNSTVYKICPRRSRHDFFSHPFLFVFFFPFSKSFFFKVGREGGVTPRQFPLSPCFHLIEK